ncbi:MAG: hypothetical protein QF415_02325 [Candidatus Undinarchaeales archaeon]|jgi:hypothetical protein|nr:hypothetical protein [Candidatus Undinarchaeales archaeon]MDP7492240.1 hypothetical protein [Candidatus Undinarchaeales archaeon]
MGKKVIVLALLAIAVAIPVIEQGLLHLAVSSGNPDVCSVVSMGPCALWRYNQAPTRMNSTETMDLYLCAILGSCDRGPEVNCHDACLTDVWRASASASFSCDMFTQTETGMETSPFAAKASSDLRTICYCQRAANADNVTFLDTLSDRDRDLCLARFAEVKQDAAYCAMIGGDNTTAGGTYSTARALCISDTVKVSLDNNRTFDCDTVDTGASAVLGGVRMPLPFFCRSRLARYSGDVSHCDAIPEDAARTACLRNWRS